MERILTISSTPTYSPESGMLYFGTAEGRIWAYDTVEGRSLGDKRLRNHRVSHCPIMTSPVVIRVEGRDLVVVSDKNDGCIGAQGGSAYVTWGLDRLDEISESTNYTELEGSWMTPSPVQVPARDGGGPAILVGADGTAAPCFGQAHQLMIVGGPNPPYMLKPTWTYCNDKTRSGGFAGSFARNGNAAYWVDTDGRLFARVGQTGNAPEGWGDGFIPLTAGGAQAFTNTEPAIDPETNTLYVTLRNYTEPGDPFPLRGCPGLNCPEPGAPGAVIAVDITPGKAPARKWLYRMPHTEAAPLYYEAVNTAPLIIKAQKALLFGDVNGIIHSLSLDTGQPQAFMTGDHCEALDTRKILPSNTLPGRGPTTYSQQSGIGTDPMLADIPGATPLLALGTNWVRQDGKKGSRFITLRAGEPYNLGWKAPPAANPPSPWRPDTPVFVTGEVQLTNTAKLLQDLRPGRTVYISWFLADEAGFPEAPARVRHLGDTPLDGDLAPGRDHPVSFQFQPLPGDPLDGFLVGLIDPETVAYSGGMSGLVARSLLERTGRASPCLPHLREVSEEQTAAQAGDGPNRDFLDNFAFVAYRIEALMDVAIQLEAPAAVDWTPGSAYSVQIHVTNRSDKALDVPVSAAVSTGQAGGWSLGTRTVMVPARQTVTDVRNVSIIRCSDMAVVQAAANPGPRAFPEGDYADNTAAAATAVGPCSDGDPGNFSAGPGRTIIVMPDCEPEPDPTSRKVCKNYDLTWD